MLVLSSLWEGGGAEITAANLRSTLAHHCHISAFGSKHCETCSQVLHLTTPASHHHLSRPNLRGGRIPFSGLQAAYLAQIAVLRSPRILCGKDPPCSAISTRVCREHEVEDPTYSGWVEVQKCLSQGNPRIARSCEIRMSIDETQRCMSAAKLVLTKNTSLP